MVTIVMNMSPTHPSATGKSSSSLSLPRRVAVTRYGSSSPLTDIDDTGRGSVIALVSHTSVNALGMAREDD